MSTSKIKEYITDSPAFTEVEWLVFVAMDVMAFVCDLPRFNHLDASEALGS